MLASLREWAIDRGLDLGPDSNLPLRDGTRPDYDWAVGAPAPWAGTASLSVLQSCQMGHTVTLRVPDDLAAWLQETAARAGVSQGHLVREKLELARTVKSSRPFMRLAGTV